jgi:diguanylate cyclase
MRIFGFGIGEKPPGEAPAEKTSAEEKIKNLEGALEESLAEKQRNKILGTETQEALAMLAKEKEEEAKKAGEEAAHSKKESEHLREIATKDELTEVLNRRGFMEEINRIISTIPTESTGDSRKEGFHNLTLIMLDIDYFKKINDTLGHSAGDEVLKKVARHLTSKVKLRTTDFVGRFGGEEFIIALPGASEGEVMQKLTELRESMGDSGRTGIKLTEVVAGIQLVVNMSCGITTFRPGENINETIKRADKALYAAKHAGRDTAVIYDPKTMADADRMDATMVGG